MSNSTSYILLDRIDIEAANAISSPLTYGFPAITGFLGAIHALGRKLPTDAGIALGGVLIAAHNLNVHHYKAAPGADYTFNQTRNPVTRNGTTAGIVEEGKASLTVTLVVEVVADRQAHRELKESPAEFETMIYENVMQQRMAGGSLTGIRKVQWFEKTHLDKLARALVTGFILMDAQKDLIDITRELQEKQSDATALDALIEVATLHNLPREDQSEIADPVIHTVKTGRGWLVPMPVGFQSIAPMVDAGVMQNCRNPEYPSQYVESVYSLGKWVFPYRISDISACFWRYAKPQENLYLVTQTTTNI